MNQTIEALKGWRSYRKFYAKRGGHMEALHPYYQARLEESTQDSFIVIGSIVAAIVIIAIAVVL